MQTNKKTATITKAQYTKLSRAYEHLRELNLSLIGLSKTQRKELAKAIDTVEETMWQFN